MQFKIRLMRPRHFNSVLALWKETPGMSFDETCDSRSGLARFIKRNPGMSFVALIKDSLAGAVISGHDGRRGYIHHLAVSPLYRKRGIGKKLVYHCLCELEKNHIPKCNIFLFKSNRKGRAFWKNTGWNLRQDLNVMQTLTDGTCSG